MDQWLKVILNLDPSVIPAFRLPSFQPWPHLGQSGIYYLHQSCHHPKYLLPSTFLTYVMVLALDNLPDQNVFPLQYSSHCSATCNNPILSTLDSKITQNPRCLPVRSILCERLLRNPLRVIHHVLKFANNQAVLYTRRKLQRMILSDARTSQVAGYPHASAQSLCSLQYTFAPISV